MPHPTRKPPLMTAMLRMALLLFAAVPACLLLPGSAPGAESPIWEAAVPAQAGILRAVWGHSAQGVFAVGDGGTILHFNGAGWQAMASGTDSS